MKKTGCEDEIEANKEISLEVEQYRKESQKLRKILNGIHKTRYGNLNKLVDILLVVAVIALFVLRFAFHLVDDILSLEIGVLLVSVKIIWLIKTQNSYNHFLIMVLHTLEQKQNTILERLDAAGDRK